MNASFKGFPGHNAKPLLVWGKAPESPGDASERPANYADTVIRVVVNQACYAGITKPIQGRGVSLFRVVK
jgi:hypothetical protein